MHIIKINKNDPTLTWMCRLYLLHSFVSFHIVCLFIFDRNEHDFTIESHWCNWYIWNLKFEIWLMIVAWIIWNNLKVKFSITMRGLSVQCSIFSRLFCSWGFKLIYLRWINHIHRLMIHFKFFSPFGSDRCNWFAFFSSLFLFMFIRVCRIIHIQLQNQYKETMALWYCNFIKIWFRWKCLQGEQIDKLPIVSPKQISNEKDNRKTKCEKRIESVTFIN